MAIRCGSGPVLRDIEQRHFDARRRDDMSTAVDANAQQFPRGLFYDVGEAAPRGREGLVQTMCNRAT